jgi:hypothetical protein
VCLSTVGRRTDLFARDPARVPVTDFFGSVRRVDVTAAAVNLTAASPPVIRLSPDAEQQPAVSGESGTFRYMDAFPIDTLLKTA